MLVLALNILCMRHPPGKEFRTACRDSLMDGVRRVLPGRRGTYFFYVAMLTALLLVLHFYWESLKNHGTFAAFFAW